MPTRKTLEWLSRIREFVFGIQDGVISTIGFLSGMQKAIDNRRVVLVAAVAQVMTAALSMAIGAYLSTKAEKEVFDGVRKTEEDRRKEQPYVAQEELLKAFEDDGLTREEGYRIVSILTRNKTAFRRTFYEKVLGLGTSEFDKPLQAAAVMYLAFVLGGAFPIVPYLLLQGRWALPASVVFSCAALFGTGYFKGMVAQKGRLRSGIEFFAVALLSAIAGYAIGTLLGIRVE